MKNRKHRIMVEVTFDRELTAKAAARAVRDIVRGNEPHGLAHYCEVVGADAKEGNRVEAGIHRACVAAVAAELGV